MEYPYNKGPRDWQNLFAVTRFRYIEVFFFFIYFTIIGVKKTVRYTEDFVIEVRYIDAPLYFVFQI